jgi:DNA recombination protein RmuC
MDQKMRTEFFQNRAEIFQNLQSLSNTILNQITNISNLQKNQLDTFSNQLNILTSMNEGKLDSMRQLTEEKLNQRREIVYEKLQYTLEKRLGDSFKQVSERLEQVHQGLGEMKSLANGIGDLQKVFSNIKTRGTWGEVQLGTILDQILTKDQYGTNIATKKNSQERVEFAIKLPGKDEVAIWLPIDSKFPLEDYQHLIEAQESGNLLMVDESYKALENRIKNEAKEIRDKYICPPETTDFGLLFLPIEGLYAEVLRRQ